MNRDNINYTKLYLNLHCNDGYPQDVYLYEDGEISLISGGVPRTSEKVYFLGRQVEIPTSEWMISFSEEACDYVVEGIEGGYFASEWEAFEAVVLEFGITAEQIEWIDELITNERKQA